MREKIRNAPAIPDHEVLRKIGGGAYGDVWMARTVTGVMRAIKVIWRADFDNDVDFEREFEGIKNYEPISRNHTGLIPILHVGRSANNRKEQFYYYVMELADDLDNGQNFHPVEYIPRTLRSDLLAADKQPIDVDTCIMVGKETAKALAFLHEKGLAHRDIKPANIVYHTGLPKLADVGLVATPGRQTFVGTQGFVPPEGSGSRKADIYALGKILYEMATGKDRMDFPQLPECPFKPEKAKRWRALNSIICDVCDPRESARPLKHAEPLVRALETIEEGKRYRKKRSWKKGALILGCLLGITATFFALWNFNNLPSKEAVFVPVKITSSPVGAEVWTAEGEFLGTTPLAGRELEAGTQHQYEFRLQGHATIREDCFVKAPGVLLEATLPVYAPPQTGKNWSDATGMVYIPDDRGHITFFPTLAWAVGKFMRNKSESKIPLEIAKIQDGKIKRGVALMDQASAHKYCKWLTQKSITDGYLTNDFQITPAFDPEVKLTNIPSRAKKLKLAPFKCLVTRIPFATLTLTSSEEVDIILYIDGKKREFTQENGNLIIDRVLPGQRTITIEPEGFKTYSKKIEFTKLESKQLTLELKANNSVVFGKDWENSLGMALKPISESLMAAAHETTSKDYNIFCTSTDRAIPPKPAFPTGKTHPIIFVNRKDAVDFCLWLTNKERKERRIGRSFSYRLPTDAEWSLIAGLEPETGSTPFERDVSDNRTFSWGTDWPPKENGGNFSDAANSRDSKTANRSIPDYSDSHQFTSPVATYSANNYGLYDISGNVYEWVSDDFGVGNYGVTRGASWLSYQKENIYLKFRNVILPKSKNNETGFRIVLSKSE